MKDKIRQIIQASQANKPADVKLAIVDALREKVKVALDRRSEQLAKSLFNKKEG